MGNTVGSTICRESHSGVHINAGPEIGVASTKAYTSQMLCLIMFALVMSEDRISLQPRRSEIIKGLKQLPDQIRKVLELDEKVLNIAKELYEKRSLLIMGRGFNFATCLEGALKVKGLTYMHSEGIQAGELKHGPLALVDSTVPIMMIITRDHVFSKCMNALQQVTARDGRPILICEKGDTECGKFAEHCLEIPRCVDALRVFSLSFLCSCCPTTLLCFVDAMSTVRETWPSLLLWSDSNRSVFYVLSHYELFYVFSKFNFRPAFIAF